MKVFKMNDCDWVAANTVEEAKEYYIKDFDRENIDQNIIECDINTETMWYGMDFNKDLAWSNIDDLYNLTQSNPDKTYYIKKDKRSDYDIVVKLIFKEVLEIDDIDIPYLICSTEW